MDPHIRAARLIKLANLEVDLAISTAMQEYGFHANSHIIWHKLKPWLGERTIEQLRKDISYVLIPNCEMAGGLWLDLVPMLRKLQARLYFDQTWELSTCDICMRGG